jgi:hypothetical protein
MAAVTVWVREIEASVVLPECVAVECDLAAAVFDATVLVAVLEAVALCAAVLDGPALAACDFAVLDAPLPELVWAHARPAA